MVTVREAEKAGAAGATLTPCLPVLGLPPAATLAPAGHAALGHVLPRRSHLDGGVLQGCGAQGDLVATLQKGHQSPESFPRAETPVQHPRLGSPQPWTPG